MSSEWKWPQFYHGPRVKFDLISVALGNVHAGRKGEYEFPSHTLAEQFSQAVLDRFNPWGYGSYADVRGNIVYWSVGSAD